MHTLKPILFNTPMVQAILSGRKTQTRRIVKSDITIPDDASFGFDWFTRERGKNEIACRGTFGEQYAECFIKMPYLPGDILYVRETWAQPYGKGFYYAADYGEYDILEADSGDVSVSKNMVKWSPSIHMPKNAARIFLRVTRIRVERLQEITDEDAKAEGANVGAGIDEKMRRSARERFAEIWDRTLSANAVKYYWTTNPWVWVYTFKRIEKQEVEKWLEA